MDDARHRIHRNRNLFDAIRSAMTLVDSVSPTAMARLIGRHGLVKVQIEAAW